MLYTGKGDGGTTKILTSKERIGKDSSIVDTLGKLDEANSAVGVARALSRTYPDKIYKDQALQDVLLYVQNTLFIIQAELAGSDKSISKDDILHIENIINDIDKKLPEIKSFFIAGSSEIEARLDFARTFVRRAERALVLIHNREVNISDNTLAYINRLSSLLYALSRFMNHNHNINETAPKY